MSVDTNYRGRPRTRRRPWGVRLQLALALAALLVLWVAPASTGGTESTRLPVAQSAIGPPLKLVLIGSSPQEHPGETWGYGLSAAGFRIARYTAESGWQLQPPPAGGGGQALSGFAPARGPLAGSATPDGGVAIVGEDEAHVGQVLVRNPEGAFRDAPTLTNEASGGEPTPNALLRPGETLSASGREGVLVAAIDQPNRRTGVFLVPQESSSLQPQEDVLFYDGGEEWSREPICDQVETSGPSCARPPANFKVLGIGASSPQNAWLLAQGGSPSEGIVLFSRESGAAGPRWTRRTLGAAGTPGEPGWLGTQFAQRRLTFENTGHETVGVQVAAQATGQPLTVTGQGLWIDGQLSVEVQGRASQTASFTLYYEIGAQRVAASWCRLAPEAGSQAANLCSFPLESGLPEGPYRSFAWSGGGQFGKRVITGLGQGVSLSLNGDAFATVLGIGGASGAGAGAAFSSPEEGWLADSRWGPLTHLTTNREPDRLQAWPVPFKRPLTAIAEQPGASAGSLGTQALAVGDEGEVARYQPGEGWLPETLLNSQGAPQTKGVELRGVAWPTPTRAYAVSTGAAGANGAMWLWRAETGLWEQDPAQPPNLYPAHFTGIAFDPAKPSRGFAIGQQGLLLCYGKTWEQEPMPAELEGADGANFTSIAFAGEEALATYQIPSYGHGGGRGYSGGVLVNEGGGGKSCGGGWHVDTEAEQALGAAEVPVRVTGLPDGGAAFATSEGRVIERQGQGSPWQPAPAGAVDGYPVALAAFREGAGTLRAVVSVETENDALTRDNFGDEALLEPPPAGQAPVATAPYPLPSGGYLLRETPNGWHDEEHADYPAPSTEQLPPGEDAVDWPELPDAVLALALDPEGGEAGWAVGGQTGEIDAELGAVNVEAIQTAGVMRYPATSAGPPGFSSSPEPLEAGEAAFAIGGNAQCATACAELAEDGLGPDVWLENALSEARQTGVRDFLYTGPRLAPGLSGPGGIGATAFKGEEERYARLLQSGEGEGKMGVFAAPAESDLDAGGTLASFSEAMGPLSPGGSAPEMPLPGSGAYSFVSTGAGGPVWVIVLDYSHPTLGEAQQCWLAQQLAEARAYEEGRGAPAIVIGNRAMAGASHVAADASQVIPILVEGAPPFHCELPRSPGGGGLPPAGKRLEPGGASAYFFDAAEKNLAYPIAAGGKSIPTFGSGTLGYVENDTTYSKDFLGASGFMLAEVETGAHKAETNVVPVHVKVIPDISALSLEGTDGLLLRRSHPALFRALARRPPAGLQCTKELSSCGFSPSPYVPIPSACDGSECATGMFPEYTFSSSNPDVGQFVERDPASPEEAIVVQGAAGKPIPDERVGERGGQPFNERSETIPRQESGLFCPYNAGTTTVAVHAGDLSYAETVTVRAGSVEQPCGTVPLRHRPAPSQQSTLAAPPPAPAPAPASAPSGSLPPPTLPPAPVPAPILVPHVQHSPTPLPPAPPFTPAQLYPLVALPPPPAPAAGRPTPPSGTAQVPAQSPVSQPVGVTEKEEEQQGATELVHHMVAYEHHPGEAPLPYWPLGLVLVAAAAGVGMRRPTMRTATIGSVKRKP